MGLFSAIGGIVGGIFGRKAEKKAFKRQAQALADQRKFLESQYDVKILDRLASEYDEKRAKRRLTFQKELEPELAELRELSRKQLLQEARVPAEARPSGRIAQQLFERVQAGEPRLERFKEQLIDRAEQELSAGATLSPEFQAELVRTGIQAGSQAGIGASQQAIGGPIARLLGSAGLQLKREREQQAVNLANEAQNISNARTSILANVFPSLKELENQTIRQATSGLQISESTLPETGLSGSEALGLRLQQLEGLLGVKKGQGQARVQSALAKGQFQERLSGQVGALGDQVVNTLLAAFTGGIGGLGGAAAGAAGAAGGADLSSVGGILGSSSSPEAAFEALAQGQTVAPNRFDYSRFLKGLF